MFWQMPLEFRPSLVLFIVSSGRCDRGKPRLMVSSLVWWVEIATGHKSTPRGFIPSNQGDLYLKAPLAKQKGNEVHKCGISSGI